MDHGGIGSRSLSPLSLSVLFCATPCAVLADGSALKTIVRKLASVVKGCPKFDRSGWLWPSGPSALLITSLIRRPLWSDYHCLPPREKLDEKSNSYRNKFAHKLPVKSECRQGRRGLGHNGGERLDREGLDLSIKHCRT